MLTNANASSHDRETDTNVHRRILIIEDDPDQQFLLKDLIAILGYDVKSASGALAGLRLAKSFNPDVILCDIGLPDMDGYDLVHALRTDRRFENTFIIAMSGYGQPAPDTTEVSDGFDRHLVKPVEMETLDRLLADATRRVSEKAASTRTQNCQIGGPSRQTT